MLVVETLHAPDAGDQLNVSHNCFLQFFINMGCRFFLFLSLFFYFSCGCVSLWFVYIISWYFLHNNGVGYIPSYIIINSSTSFIRSIWKYRNLDDSMKNPGYMKENFVVCIETLHAGDVGDQLNVSVVGSRVWIPDRS